MYSNKFFILTAIFLAMASAQGKTLIVTHPEQLFDRSNSAGKATRRLLQDPQFDSKIVLVSGAPLTFSPEGLSFESRPSKVGEIIWTKKDSEIYLAGGYWEACFATTLIDLIRYSDPGVDLNLHVSMKATYTTGKYDPPNLTSLTLEQFFDNPSPVQTNVDFVGIPALAYDIINSQVLAALRAPTQLENTMTVKMVLDGQVVSTFGNGPQLINITFERDL